MSHDRKLQESIDKRSAAVMELERKYRVLLKACLEVEEICTESAGACRKRMGTRVGNSLVAVREALKETGNWKAAQL